MARWRRAETVAAALFAGFLACASSGPDALPALGFARHSQPVASLDLAALRRALEPRAVRVFEPYEEGEARFLGFAFAEVLDAAYGESWRGEEELLFTCRDGYQPSIPVARVLQHRAWLAFERLDADGFHIWKLESGRRQRIGLAPFYLVWENRDDPQLRQEGDYGWPYQLVGVDLIRIGERFPRMLPPAGAPAQVQAGFRAFRIHCTRCHAVNGEGGSIGADLNQPRSPVEYREREWLRRWIDDPSTLLATARMPRLNPALPDRGRVIDEILAYLSAMSRGRHGD